MDRYHYTQSGLPNVWLLNGFRFQDTPYGCGVAIENVEALHRAIAHVLTEKSGPLTGAELRFLRLELDMSQKRLGEMLGKKDGQAVARWEKDERVPDGVDFVVRHIYAQKIEKGRQSYVELVDHLHKLDRQTGFVDLSFEETEQGWRKAS